MVLRFGMGPRLGLTCPVTPGDACSAQLQRVIEGDVARLLRTACGAARATMRRKATLTRRIAEALMRRGTITGEDIGQLGH